MFIIEKITTVSQFKSEKGKEKAQNYFFKSALYVFFVKKEIGLHSVTTHWLEIYNGLFLFLKLEIEFEMSNLHQHLDGYQNTQGDGQARDACAIFRLS